MVLRVVDPAAPPSRLSPGRVQPDAIVIASRSETPETVEQFLLSQGFDIARVPSAWHFKARGGLEAVVRIEFPAELAEELLHEHAGTTIEYHYAAYWRRYE